jgi:cation transport ATPase
MPEDEEDEKDRLNRKLIELLNEVRVALPGVQVLFAFLLVLPFNQGFQRVTDLQRDVYAGTLACAAFAAILLIAVTAYHRLRWRQLEKEQMDEKHEMLVTQSHLVVAGLTFLSLSVIGTLFLIFDFLFNAAVAAATSLAMAGAYAWFWYGLPLSRRARDGTRKD